MYYTDREQQVINTINEHFFFSSLPCKSIHCSSCDCEILISINIIKLESRNKFDIFLNQIFAKIAINSLQSKLSRSLCWVYHNYANNFLHYYYFFYFLIVSILLYCGIISNDQEDHFFINTKVQSKGPAYIYSQKVAMLPHSE